MTSRERERELNVIMAEGGVTPEEAGAVEAAKSPEQEAVDLYNQLTDALSNLKPFQEAAARSLLKGENKVSFRLQPEDKVAYNVAAYSDYRASYDEYNRALEINRDSDEGRWLLRIGVITSGKGETRGEGMRFQTNGKVLEQEATIEAAKNEIGKLQQAATPPVNP